MSSRAASLLCMCVRCGSFVSRFSIVCKKACRNVPNCLIVPHHYTAVWSRFPEANCAEE